MRCFGSCPLHFKDYYRVTLFKSNNRENEVKGLGKETSVFQHGTERENSLVRLRYDRKAMVK